jgi:hypothetical protein
LTRSSSFDQVTGSAGSISILKKIQNGVVLIKIRNKNQRVATGFCRVNPPDRPGHDFSYFFINPARFQPQVGRVPDRPARPGFKTMESMILIPILVNGHITRPSKYQLLLFSFAFSSSVEYHFQNRKLI